jgi:hypothetical protein
MRLNDHKAIACVTLASIVLALSACASPSDTLSSLSSTAGSQYQTCMREAEWPAYHTSTYRHWNERQRESMDPTEYPGVAHMQAICHSLFFNPQADMAALWQSCQNDVAKTTTSQFGAGADDYARRMLAVCRVATGQTT